MQPLALIKYSFLCEFVFRIEVFVFNKIYSGKVNIRLCKAMFDYTDVAFQDFTNVQKQLKSLVHSFLLLFIIFTPKFYTFLHTLKTILKTFLHSEDDEEIFNSFLMG